MKIPSLSLLSLPLLGVLCILPSATLAATFGRNHCFCHSGSQVGHVFDYSFNNTVDPWKPPAPQNTYAWQDICSEPLALPGHPHQRHGKYSDYKCGHRKSHQEDCHVWPPGPNATTDIGTSFCHFSGRTHSTFWFGPTIDGLKQTRRIRFGQNRWEATLYDCTEQCRAAFGGSPGWDDVQSTCNQTTVGRDGQVEVKKSRQPCYQVLYQFDKFYWDPKVWDGAYGGE